MNKNKTIIIVIAAALAVAACAIGVWLMLRGKPADDGVTPTQAPTVTDGTETPAPGETEDIAPVDPAEQTDPGESSGETAAPGETESGSTDPEATPAAGESEDPDAPVSNTTPAPGETEAPDSTEQTGVTVTEGDDGEIIITVPDDQGSGGL